MTAKLTTDEFRSRAQALHGDHYDYSPVEYRDTGTPVRIICLRRGHGEFLCSPRNHLRPVNPRGCPKCGRERQIKSATKPFEMFKAEAQTVHSGRYSYIAKTYRGARKKMSILCEKHGEFRQSPDSHLRGAGCPKCSTEAWTGKYRGEHAQAAARRVEELSGGTVKLDMSSYWDQNAEAMFSCQLHGKFSRRVILALLKTHPCPECAWAAQDKFPPDMESLKSAILLALGKGYAVEPFNYNRRCTEVTLQCSDPEHPSFQRIIANIGRLRGCPDCGQQVARRKRQKTISRLAKSSRANRFEAWLEAASDIHSHKFDYSNVVYKTARDKVRIICPVHGPFWQTPADHIAGGCRKCANVDLKGLYSEVFRGGPTISTS